MQRDSMKIYCPTCGRDIEPSNAEDVESGTADGFIYIHDDMPHEDDDIKALSVGVN